MTPRPEPRLVMAPSFTAQALLVKQTQPSRVLPSKREVILSILSNVSFDCGEGGFAGSASVGAAGVGFVAGCASRLVASITPRFTKQVVFMVRRSRFIHRRGQALCWIRSLSISER